MGRAMRSSSNIVRSTSSASTRSSGEYDGPEAGPAHDVGARRHRCGRVELKHHQPLGEVEQILGPACVQSLRTHSQLSRLLPGELDHATSLEALSDRAAELSDGAGLSGIQGSPIMCIMSITRGKEVDQGYIPPSPYGGPMAESTEAATIYFPDAASFESWLETNVDFRPGVWLKLAKAGSGAPSLTPDEAVDLGLCYGWISGQRRGLDETFYLQKYVPRRPKSRWSQVNVRKVEALTAQGRMRAPGLAEVEAAKADGRWGAAYVPQSEFVVPADLTAALDEHPVESHPVRGTGPHRAVRRGAGAGHHAQPWAAGGSARASRCQARVLGLRGVPEPLP